LCPPVNVKNVMITMSYTIKKLEAHVVAECQPVDRESLFDSMLDECHSFASVGGPFKFMSPSSVLKSEDPTAYRCGVNDWADGEDFVEVDGETYNGPDVEAAREEFVAELETDLSTLEKDQEENADAEESSDADEGDGIQKQIDDLKAQIEEARDHSF